MRRLWNYIKAWFGVKSKEVMDPEIEIEQAITEARKQDQALRVEAAKVIANRTQVAARLEDATQDAAEAKELAKQALLKADGATQAGNADEAVRWNQAAKTIAMRLQAANANVETLTGQLTTAEAQAQQAQQAVNQNAMRLEEISAKRMKMMGQLQAAKMQEAVNKTMESLQAKVGGDAPSFDEIEQKIEARAAQASATAELASSTPEGAMAELEQAVDLAEADQTLDGLRVELGLGPKPELPASGGSSTPA